MTRASVTTVVAVLLTLAGVTARAQDAAPAYSRGGFDYFSAPVEVPPMAITANACEKQYGKGVEVRQLQVEYPDSESPQPVEYQCDVMTASEPRLSAKLKDELALIEAPEPRRQRLADALVERYRLLAQCPAGTRAAYDGSMYVCARKYSPKELCAVGAVVPRGEGLGCGVVKCAAGATNLATLTGGKQRGCFTCPKGTFDQKETDAFHGALNGMPVEYTEVFCKVAHAVK